jgi:hypothetical protein
VTHFKLIAELERDIRNQVVIDQMKRLSRPAHCKVFLIRHRLLLFFSALATVWTMGWVFMILFVNWP